MPWPTVGGTEQATLRIAEAVRPYGFESVAFCPSEKSPVHEMFAAAGFETVSYHPVEHSYRRAWPFLRYSWQLAREFRRSKIDLVHCADLLAAYYAALAGKMARLPVLCQIRNRFSDISRRDKSFLYPVDHFAFVSRDTWRKFALEVNEKKGTVIYDGIDVAEQVPENVAWEVRKELSIPAEAKVVGMVARVAPQKDYPTLIRAAARILEAEPNTRFLIVGDIEAGVHRHHYEKIKELLIAYGIDNSFVFAGFRRDVPRMIASMDVFVLCTHCEGLPLVILEAMSQGKPVVATDIDGIPEIVIHEKTGLLHTHEDDEQLAKYVLAILQDRALAKKLGEAGRLAVKENWSRERFAKDMAGLYAKILNINFV